MKDNLSVSSYGTIGKKPRVTKDYSYKDRFKNTEEANHSNFGSMMQFELGVSIAKADPFMNLRKSIAGDT